MDKKLLISVVVAAFNEEKYLPACLESLLKQNFPKDAYEIIVVDNNSIDKTAEIAEQYHARVVREHRQGNTFAISKGMSSAKGEIIATLDADTIALPGWLENMRETFLNPEVVAATGPGLVKTGNKILDFISEKFFDLFILINFAIGKPHLCGFNLAVRKKAFDEIGGVDEKFTMSSDVDLGLRVKKRGKVVFVGKMKALTSTRRWHKGIGKAIITYISGYIWTVWLRRPPPVKQNVVR